jgi:ureidoglycolate lyase
MTDAIKLNPQFIRVEPATPEGVAPFGRFIGAHPDLPVFAQWPGVIVTGPAQIEIGSGAELLHVQMQAAAFPARVALLERHFKHTQTYLSANGRPFVMVLGAETRDGLPDLAGLRAFLFKDGAGVAMDAGVWHEFPLAIEDDTRFTVILRSESHVNDLVAPEHPWDARGPDLERYDMGARGEIYVGFSDGAG